MQARTERTVRGLAGSPCLARSQRTRAANIAIARRRSGASLAAQASPPRRPACRTSMAFLYGASLAPASRSSDAAAAPDRRAGGHSGIVAVEVLELVQAVDLAGRADLADARFTYRGHPAKRRSSAAIPSSRVSGVPFAIRVAHVALACCAQPSNP